MSVNIAIYSSPYISITQRDDGYYIQSFKKGLSIDEFQKILNSHPEIKVTNFTTIKNALVLAPQDPRRFASAKERISIEVSGDELRAFVTVNVGQPEVLGTEIVKEVVLELNRRGVVYGIKKDVLLNLVAGKTVLIAEGEPPQNGVNSQNRLYQIKEAKPEIKEDGTADHYDLNLINMVSAGEWLGEKIHATPGKEGKTVYGNPIKPLPGKDYPIFFDRKTVKAVEEEGKTTLYATRNGAVYFAGDSISVSNHLEIDENVGVKTGNVDFDGYLTVKGTIEDNYTVTTTKDIEVLSDYGVGSCKEISSREGSIYIRGGIAGKGKTVIKCKKNLYLKFVADAEIICDGSVHVGFYCLNSNIIAKEVILESLKGQIIGGNITADIRVLAATYGTPSEKRTNICVKGFDRIALKDSLEQLVQEIDQLKTSMNQYKQQISIFNISDAVKSRKSEYEKLNENYNNIRAELQVKEELRKNIAGYLKVKGEGEISILKKAFPNTFFEIKRIQKEIQTPILRTSFYYSEGTIKEL
ncbi:DUF342 domain-containing protein [Ruminiclostridium cellulolyticum]|uniref:Flagellar Assembly Protein A N-terminal region domain-containing protein n=1 Tax=Ruminiclostridium cellulolyticum (strain ATCC 35319 / DSM 5812 / JCM 6584 / H10) TaxID=394503 RepID=B8I3T9_RUMCH|nr:FapA family protein [Ruminiclostridium cellulolyticum]ACL74416.1 protein of unknown function DUF342 [Ruminiclostridium cellulolyticum H10]